MNSNIFISNKISSKERSMQDLIMDFFTDVETPVDPPDHKRTRIVYKCIGCRYVKLLYCTEEKLYYHVIKNHFDKSEWLKSSPNFRLRAIYNYNYLRRRHGLLLSYQTDAIYLPNYNNGNSSTKRMLRSDSKRQEDQEIQVGYNTHENSSNLCITTSKSNNICRKLRIKCNDV